MEELHLWNVEYQSDNRVQVFAALNDLQPGMHSVGPFHQHPGQCARMVEMTKEDALKLALSCDATIVRVDKDDVTY